MNNLIGNFVGFEGRINRQKWWMGVIILIVVGIVLYLILSAIMGTGFVMDASVATDPGAMAAYLQKAAWVGLIGGVLLAYPYTAITVKRRHDRNNNGYDAMALTGLQILSNVLAALGLALGPVSMVLGLIVLVLAIWTLVQAGFLKGTAGPNNYGPDPLGG